MQTMFDTLTEYDAQNVTWLSQLMDSHIRMKTTGLMMVLKSSEGAAYEERGLPTPEDIPLVVQHDYARIFNDATYYEMHHAPLVDACLFYERLTGRIHEYDKYIGILAHAPRDAVIRDGTIPEPNRVTMRTTTALLVDAVKYLDDCDFKEHTRAIHPCDGRTTLWKPSEKRVIEPEVKQFDGVWYYRTPTISPSQTENGWKLCRRMN